VWHLINRKVAHLELIGRIGSRPVGDKLRSQLTRNRTLLAGAAFDYQDVCHVVCSIEGLMNVDGQRIEAPLSIKKRKKSHLTIE
jgi:hypothetical protein